MNESSFFPLFAGYLETRLTSPLSVPFVTSELGLSRDQSRFWGSFRPGVYFGMKTRSPRDVLAGIMWMMPEMVTQQERAMNE